MPYKNYSDEYAYRKRVQRKYTVTFSLRTEKDIIDYLDSHKPNNAFLKAVIREHMKTHS